MWNLFATGYTGSVCDSQNIYDIVYDLPHQMLLRVVSGREWIPSVCVQINTKQYGACQCTFVVPVGSIVLEPTCSNVGCWMIYYLRHSLMHHTLTHTMISCASMSLMAKKPTRSCFLMWTAKASTLPAVKNEDLRLHEHVVLASKSKFTRHFLILYSQI